MPHCPPPPLGTGQNPVTNITDANTTVSDATGGSGTRVGIFVFFPPSYANPSPPAPPPAIPLEVPNPTGANIGDLQTALNNAGFVFVYPAFMPHFSVKGTGYFGNIYEDVANDAGHGTRYTHTCGLWCDHLFDYLAAKYGGPHPTIFGGFSIGAWMSLQMAVYGSPSGATWPLVGYQAHCPATLFEHVTAFYPPYNNGLLQWAGMDLSTTALNNVTIPGLVGYSNSDGTAGWALSTDPGYLGPPQSSTYEMTVNAQNAGRPLSSYQAACWYPTGTDPVPYPNGHLFLPNDATTVRDWAVSLGLPVSF